MLLFILQAASNAENSTWYYIAQFIPIFSTLAGILAMMAGVWSKWASDRNACTLKILLEKLEADKLVHDKEMSAIKAYMEGLMTPSPAQETQNGTTD